jgi:hypothetical protein
MTAHSVILAGVARMSISDKLLIEIPGAGPTDMVVNGDDVYTGRGVHWYPWMLA